MGTQSVNRREERGVSGRGLRGALLREVDGQPQLVAAVDRERLLLRPDHARHPLDVLALLLELLDRVRCEGVLPEVQALQVRQGEDDLQEQIDDRVRQPIVRQHERFDLRRARPYGPGLPT